MKNFLVKIALLLFPLFSFCQEEIPLFSDAVRVNLSNYKNKSELAYKNKDFAKGRFLFDSLVKNQLIGTRFNDYSFKKINSNKLKLSSIKKPIVVQTYASWCVTGKGEIAALNKLAQQYGKDIEFIVIFWDKKQNVKKIAKKFMSRITICYAHETYKNDAYAISSIKHTLGFPTSFYLDENKKVIDIQRNGTTISPKMAYSKAFNENYSYFKNGVSKILIGTTNPKEQIARN